MTPRVKFHNDVDHTLDRLMFGVVGRIKTTNEQANKLVNEDKRIVLTMDTK